MEKPGKKVGASQRRSFAGREFNRALFAHCPLKARLIAINDRRFLQRELESAVFSDADTARSYKALVSPRAKL
jgi:hypothetical protein